MGVSSDLARELSAIGPLTEKDREQMRTLMIDFFAAAYAGYRQKPYCKAQAEYLRY